MANEKLDTAAETQAEESTTTGTAEAKPDIRQLDVKDLVALMPDSDEPGKTSTFTGPSPDTAAEVFEEILSRGREGLLELVGLLRDPADPEFKDFRPEYVVHGLAIYLGTPEKAEQRRRVAEALASRLANPDVPKAVKMFLIRELQVVGAEEVAGALGRTLADEELCESAAQALAAIGNGAAAQLRTALRAAKGKCRVTILQNLGVVRDGLLARQVREALADEDREARLAAAWALARMGDPESAEAVLKAADAAEGWERIKATQACLLLAENLLAAGLNDEAGRVYKHLRDSRTDPTETYVREAAERALETAAGA